MCHIQSATVAVVRVSCHVVRSAGNQSPTDMIVSGMCHQVNDNGATFLILLSHNKTTLLQFPWRINALNLKLVQRG